MMKAKTCPMGESTDRSVAREWAQRIANTMNAPRILVQRQDGTYTWCSKALLASANAHGAKLTEIETLMPERG